MLEYLIINIDDQSVVPYGDMELGQQWLSEFISTWGHLAMTWAMLIYHQFEQVTFRQTLGINP